MCCILSSYSKVFTIYSGSPRKLPGWALALAKILLIASRNINDGCLVENHRMAAAFCWLTLANMTGSAVLPFPSDCTSGSLLIEFH